MVPLKHFLSCIIVSLHHGAIRTLCLYIMMLLDHFLWYVIASLHCSAIKNKYIDGNTVTVLSASICIFFFFLIIAFLYFLLMYKLFLHHDVILKYMPSLIIYVNGRSIRTSLHVWLYLYRSLLICLVYIITYMFGQSFMNICIFYKEINNILIVKLDSEI